MLNLDELWRNFHQNGSISTELLQVTEVDAGKLKRRNELAMKPDSTVRRIPIQCKLFSLSCQW